MSPPADLTPAENNLAGQFMLNGKVVVLRVRHRESRIEDVERKWFKWAEIHGGACSRWRERERTSDSLAGLDIPERIGKAGRTADIGDPGSAQGEGRRYKVLKRELFFRPVVVDPVTCAEARLAGAARAPCETEAWAEVFVFCRDASRVIATPVSGKDHTGGGGQADGVLLARPPRSDGTPSIEKGASRRINLPSDAIGDCEVLTEI